VFKVRCLIIFFAAILGHPRTTYKVTARARPLELSMLCRRGCGDPVALRSIEVAFLETNRPHFDLYYGKEHNPRACGAP
jgi:hypothetical protein